MLQLRHRKTVPSEATAATPAFASSRRARDAVKARTGAVSVLELAIVTPCARCGTAMRTTLLCGFVPEGVREGAGHLADVEIVGSLCPACRETI